MFGTEVPKVGYWFMQQWFTVIIVWYDKRKNCLAMQSPA